MVLVAVACLVGEILHERSLYEADSLTVTGLDGSGGDKGAKSA